ncbi:hypothetical protein GCM10010156_52680 [Planobispora rosea]|uniref:Uncharacterized protein n=1 Tax=Planobispora rosea TaxID=35762 RepID=A0A8J3S4J2_PLARO|nr:hypothetical protein [Planobispora rosea]GGS87633.1 hypothetical protein GCM10010156_52680 [Planobispora rosea]GIH86670.1 hypothetical protein Pro02_50780 [Planobispora rosea]
MGVVYATTDCVVAWSQGQSPLSKGDVWDERAPLVKERPDLFATEPTRVRGRQAILEDEPPVETAAAAPGTARATKRRAAKE